MQIHNNQLNFNKLTQDDFYLYAQLVTNEEVMKYITGQALTPEEAKLRFQKAVDAGKKNNDNGFFIVRNQDNKFIGVAKLVQINDSQYEVGYMLLPEHWGKGFASEMVETMISFAREKQVNELIGIVDPENPASIRVLTKFGFELYETGEIDGLAAAYYKLELENFNTNTDKR